mmetsp:Transcript_49/g.136  ORF Transcript_49/g.136 Transcript_49/m.136 type:complete len:277 (-) Transcript_49:108-938(-)|eukprot:CAMPEP_0114555084 /NCGR_PEP_ID=MMETSP0114-20121206/8559_1 /TAXON_ID=31324 /ORGANISM="Goniomonas sp, Strain m" /LENGTH=276 /DNA_ID=CAMNT_0001740183 /DNA_START=163 /DNA_END=993 /DNA_ORIENTATION=+
MASKNVVNMNGSDDPFYRYTMPAVQTKVEGTTKMIKTILTNIDDLSASIARPVDYIVTYFGQELSANSKVDTKTQKAYVTGHMKLEDLQAACFKFIREHVLCKHCGNPETIVNVVGKGKKKDVVLLCKGCGGKTTLDSTDRFVKYQALHPPDISKADLKLLKAKKTAAGAPAGGGGALGPDDADDDEEKKEKKSKKSKKSKKDKKEKEESEDDDDDWCMDTSEEAVKARAAEANADAVLEAAAAVEAKAAKQAEEQMGALTLPEVDDDEVDDIDNI